MGLRCFFLAFAIIVLACGAALLGHTTGILPWDLGEQTTLLVGWIFVGLSFEYAYVALRGTLSDARVLLVGFLVYVAAFMVPLLWHFGAVHPDYLASLVINIGVLALSIPIAVYYLKSFGLRGAVAEGEQRPRSGV